jgi:uncharacterized protein with PIN domain
MPIDLRCDRCNKKITTVSYEKIREYVQKNGETCAKCLKLEESIRVFYVGLKKSYDRKMDQLIKKALDELTSKIEAQSNVEHTD